MDKLRQFLSLRVAFDLNSVAVNFNEVFDVEPGPGQTESKEVSIPFKCPKVPYRPHKNLTDSMTKLRKYALQHLGIELTDESKQIKQWSVPAIKLDGDHLKNKARVTITLATKSDYTSDPKEIETGQITMYPTSEDRVKNPNHEKIAAIVEDIIVELNEYLDGKHESNDKPDPQMALFGARVTLAMND
jgi:hypothetical protein